MNSNPKNTMKIYGMYVNSAFPGGVRISTRNDSKDFDEDVMPKFPVEYNFKEPNKIAPNPHDIGVKENFIDVEAVVENDPTTRALTVVKNN
jgi:hypothetical protein